MAVYKCHRGCVRIHRGSYQLLDVLLPQRSTLCLSLPLRGKWSWCVYIDTHLLSAISVASFWWNMDVRLALFHPASFSKSVPHAYLLTIPKSWQLVAACPLPPLFFIPCFINYVYLCVMKYECVSFLFLSRSFLPLTGCFSQVSLSDEIWMRVPSPSPLHLPGVSAVHRCGMKYGCLSPVGAVNAKCYLSITGGIMSVLSKSRELYVLFWLMKCFSYKYTSSDRVISWIPGY